LSELIAALAVVAFIVGLAVWWSRAKHSDQSLWSWLRRMR
jgi:uncharacterized iron-regulated membrane protein